MEDDEGRAEPLGEIDGLKGLANGPVAFLRIGGRDFVTIRRSVRDLDGQWTEVVEAGELDFTGLIHFLNTGHERNADAVAELDPIKPEVLDFAQHFCAV